MAVVGSAEVVVRAITSQVRKDIENAFRDARPAIERAGRDAARRFSDEFKKELGNNLSSAVTDSLDSTEIREKARVIGRGVGNDIISEAARDIRRGSGAVGDAAAAALGDAGNRGGRAFKTGLDSAWADSAVAASRAFTSIYAIANIAGPGLAGLVGIISSIVSGLYSMVSAAGAAAGALAVLPGLLSVAMQGLGVTQLAFGGIGEALKAGTAAQQAAATSTGGLTGATQRSTAANDAARVAQERLTKAREDARKKIDDLRKAANNATAYSDAAARDEARAIAIRDALVTDPNVSADKKIKAEQRVVEARRRNRRLQTAEDRALERADAAERRGVDGTKGVLAAEKALEDARKRQQAAGAAGGMGAAAKAANAYEQALAKLHPAAQEFVKQLLSMQSTLERFRTTAQANLFPGLTQALIVMNEGLLDAGTKGFPALETSVGRTARQIGLMGEQIATALFSGEGLRNLQSIFDGNVRILRVFTEVGESGRSTMANLALAVSNVLVAIQPLTERFARWIDSLVQGAAASEGFFYNIERMEGFFAKAGDRAALLGDIIGNVVGLFVDLGRTADDAGEGLLQSFNGYLEGLRDYINEPINNENLRQYFADVADNLRDISELARAVGRAFSGLADNEGVGDFAQALVPAVDNLAEMGEILADSAPALGEFAEKLTEVLLAFTDSGAIQTFFEIINSALGVLSDFVSSDFGAQLVLIVGTIAAITRALQILFRVGNFGFKVLAGGPIAFARNLRGVRTAATSGQGLFGTMIRDAGVLGASFIGLGGDADRTALATERMSRRMRVALRGGLGIGAVALASSGLLGELGELNTTMYAMIGATFGPWGAALGGLIGFIQDVRSTSSKLNDVLKETDALGKTTNFASIFEGADKIEESNDALEGTRNTISGVIRAIPLVGGYEGAISKWMWGDDEKKADKINDDLDRMRESAERLAVSLGAQQRTVQNPIANLFDWAAPTITITDQDDVLSQLTRAQPALDALGITLEEYSNLDISSQTRVAQDVNEWLSTAARTAGDLHGLTRTVSGLSPEIEGLSMSFEDASDYLNDMQTEAGRSASSFLGLGDSLTDSKTSLSDWIAELEKQGEALKNFRKNAEKAAENNVNQGLIDSLLEQGEAGALRLEELASAGEDVVTRANRAWRAQQREFNRQVEADHQKMIRRLLEAGNIDFDTAIQLGLEIETNNPAMQQTLDQIADNFGFNIIGDLDVDTSQGETNLLNTIRTAKDLKNWIKQLDRSKAEPMFKILGLDQELATARELKAIIDNMGNIRTTLAAALNPFLGPLALLTNSRSRTAAPRSTPRATLPGLTNPSVAPRSMAPRSDNTASRAGLQINIGNVQAHDYQDFLGQMQRRERQANLGGFGN